MLSNKYVKRNPCFAHLDRFLYRLRRLRSSEVQAANTLIAGADVQILFWLFYRAIYNFAEDPFARDFWTMFELSPPSLQQAVCTHAVLFDKMSDTPVFYQDPDAYGVRCGLCDQETIFVLPPDDEP